MDKEEVKQEKIRQYQSALINLFEDEEPRFKLHIFQVHVIANWLYYFIEKLEELSEREKKMIMEINSSKTQSLGEIAPSESANKDFTAHSDLPKSALSLCPYCNCMTKSSGAGFCGKCNNPKEPTS